MQTTTAPADASSVSSEAPSTLPRQPSRESETPDQHLTIIRATPGWRWINVRELWHYRDLIFSFAQRDIQVRYKQTVLGVAWAVIEPVTMMVVFTVVMGRMARVPTGGIPYPIFVFSGLLLWNFFARSITNASQSMLQAQTILTKVYIPRLSVPFSSVGAPAVDFVVAMVVLLGMMLWYQVALSVQILLVPLLLLLATMAALGVGAFLSALNVTYRDFKHTLPLLVQVWMFATPTIYMDPAAAESNTQTEAAAASGKSATAAEAENSAAGQRSTAAAGSDATNSSSARWVETLKSVLERNPMSGLIAAFRAAILNRPIAWSSLGYSAAAIVVMFGGGCLYFRRMERTFADVI